MITEIIKNKLRSFIRGNVIAPLQLDSKTSPLCQINQIALARKFADSPASFDMAEVGFSVFSEFEEDGILIYLFAALGSGNKRLVEIGCGDGLQNNSTNLIVNHRWSGVLIDADESNIKTARNYFENAKATKLLPPAALKYILMRLMHFMRTIEPPIKRDPQKMAGKSVCNGLNRRGYKDPRKGKSR